MKGVRRLAYCCLALLGGCLSMRFAVGQFVNLVPTSSTAVARTVRGKVVNGSDGMPVPRVLVMLNSRSQLTDSEGRFEFREFSDAQGYVTLTRPGYSQSNDMSWGGGGGRQRIADLDAITELKIYPDALVSGLVTGRDGLPLTDVPVTLRRAIYDQTGLKWAPIRSVQTDLHGEYRFHEPAGRFQVSTGYIAHFQVTGEVILPQLYPDIIGSSTRSYFEVESGQEQRIDLRPRTGPAYTIPVKVESSETQRGVQFYAITSSGQSFQVPSTGSGSGLIYQISLPTGTYTLQGKLESREVSLEGSTKLTVTGPRTETTILHLEPAMSLPLELAIDPNSAVSTANSSQANFQTSQLPDTRQLNLHLHKTTSVSPLMNQDIAIRQKEDKSYEFRVPPGTYRLDANGGGVWFVESASYGMANLATSEITLGSGGSGVPIRVVLNNAYGTISATIKSSGYTDTIWVYLIPDPPRLSPINAMGIASGSPGTTTTFSTRAPAGSYAMIALDHQLQDDLRNPEVAERFSANARHVDIAASATATVLLEVATEKELAR